MKSILAEDGVLWVGTTRGLFRLAEGGDGRYDVAVPALVREVTADGENVPVLDQAASAPYGASVRFRFAAAAFDDPAGTRYRTQLVGFDDEPSAWSDERFRDYTNLPPGEYAFRVEAQTAQGALARPATVAVTVPPPWYLTRWAAVLWALLTGFVLAFVAWAASTQQRRAARAERARADELESLNEALRRADKLKDDMLANTSHELRTPLVAVLGFAELLAEYDGEDPAEVREYARHMLSGGNRLLRTANDILDVARLRAGRVELDSSPVDAVTVVRDVVAELAPLAADRGIALLATPPSVSLPSVLDAEAVGRVVTNLVSNAIKFTEEGSVTVTVAGDAEALRIAVADTGRGIDPSFLPSLFEEYQQESTGYGRVAEGSGLGLAITKRLVDLMGGTIEVESEVGAGTTFRVRLPREVAPATSGDGQVLGSVPEIHTSAQAE